MLKIVLAGLGVLTTGVFIALLYLFAASDLPNLQQILPKFSANQQENEPKKLATTIDPEPTTPDTAAVLGITNEQITPATLYGLMNGFRRDAQQAPLLVDPALERAASRLTQDLHTQTLPDPHELANSLGYQGKDVKMLTVLNPRSNWAVLESLSLDARNSLLLASSSFSQMGASIECFALQGDDHCLVVVLLGSE